MNKTETILLFQKIMLELEQLKQKQLEMKNLLLKSHEVIATNQVKISNKIDQLTKK